MENNLSFIKRIYTVTDPKTYFSGTVSEHWTLWRGTVLFGIECWTRTQRIKIENERFQSKRNVLGQDWDERFDLDAKFYILNTVGTFNLYINIEESWEIRCLNKS